MDIEQGGDYEFSDPIDAFLSLNGAFQGVTGVQLLHTLNCSPGRHFGSRASSSSRRTQWALCLQLDPLRIAKLLRVSSIQTPTGVADIKEI
jgi:hypothetical protein